MDGLQSDVTSSIIILAAVVVLAGIIIWRVLR